MDASTGIEPFFGVPTEVDQMRSSIVDFVKRHAPEQADVINHQAITEGTFQNVDLPEEIKECLKTAKEISALGHLKMVAALVGTDGVIDEAASKTVNLPNNATSDDILQIFLLAHNLGLKNISIYRDGSSEGQPLKL